MQQVRLSLVLLGEGQSAISDGAGVAHGISLQRNRTRTQALRGRFVPEQPPFLPVEEHASKSENSMRNSSIMAAVLAAATIVVSSTSSFAQGGGGGGGGAGGGAAGASAGASGMSGSAGTGNTSTGLGASTGASSTNTVGQADRVVSPSNPATTQPGGPNAQPLPSGTATNQNPEQFDPRLSPGYQK
jgi:hypothetical protein